MATTQKRQTTSRAAAIKKAAAPEAAPAAVTDAKTPDAATTPEAVVTAPQDAGLAAEVSPSLTVQTPEPETAQDRAARLAVFTTGTPIEAVTAARVTAAHLVTGKTEDWTDGTEEGVKALVIVDLFKATLHGSTYFGYKGTVITAPESVIERGLVYGALSKEF